MAIRGLGELKTRQRGWFRSGAVEVRIGPAHALFAPGDRGPDHRALHAEVETLLNGGL
jgi:long-chain acyl-CoA synthetase